MNATRRKQIAEAMTHIESAKLKLTDARDGEQEALDNMPENLEGSERYLRMEDVVDSLDSALDSLEEAENEIMSAMA